MTQSLDDKIEIGNTYRHSDLVEPDFTVENRLNNGTRLGGTTTDGDYIVIPRGTLLTCYHKVIDFSKAQGDSKYGEKNSNKDIWEHKEDEINNINGYEAFDILKSMVR